MSGNTFGKIFSVTTFGESHGEAMGCIIDGCPPNFEIKNEDIQMELDRRKPGQSDVTTQRKEDDKVEIMSGVFEGKTLGTPIALIIKNEDQISKDYSNIKDTFRPNHADLTYQGKYGIRDYRGGGRSSARETAMRVAAGAVAKKYLNTHGIITKGFVSQIGSISADTVDLEPVFDKLNADLAKAIMSINAVKSVSIGNSDKIPFSKGSELRDEITKTGFDSNNSGGILGGISNGDDIDISFLIKPTSSISKATTSIDKDGNEVELEIKGRHDPCVGIRAVPIAEAMVNLVLIDHLLRNQAQCGDVDQKLPFVTE